MRLASDLMSGGGRWGLRPGAIPGDRPGAPMAAGFIPGVRGRMELCIIETGGMKGAPVNGLISGGFCIIVLCGGGREVGMEIV